MSKKNLIIHMEGGFGNQLFQYFLVKVMQKNLIEIYILIIKQDLLVILHIKENLNYQLLIQDY